MIPGLLLGLLLLAAPAGAAGKSVDLSAQFPGAAVRTQGATNTCHVFSTVSLLEAAFRRRWDFGEAFSEADLFVRKVVKDPEYYDQVRKAIGSAHGDQPAYRFVEWGNAPADIAFAIKHGIAKAATAPWPEFAKRYAAFEKAQRDDLGAHDDQVVTMSGVQQDLKRDFDVLGREEQAGRMDYFANVRRSQLQQVQGEISAVQFSAKKTFFAFLTQVQGRTFAEGEDILLGVDPKRAKEHELFQRLMSGFRVQVKTYDDVELPDEKCRAAGADRKAALLAFFDRGIPLGLSMDVGGLKEWGVAKGPARHAFTVTGYKTGDDGKISLQSRNSWGGVNPEVSEDRFCRISRLVAVLTDRE